MKRIIGWVMCLTLALMPLAGCSVANGISGSYAEIPYSTGTDDNNNYDTSMFYRNDKLVFNADPYVLFVPEERDDDYGGWFYMYLTAETAMESGGIRSAFWIMRSRDLTDWTMAGAVNGGYALAVQSTDWMSTRFWAPECYYNETDGMYYMYFTSASKQGDSSTEYTSSSNVNARSYIGVARSSAPVGPFEMVTGPNADGETLTGANPQINFTKALGLAYDFSVIDAHLFADGDALYLYFVEHLNVDRPNGGTSVGNIWCVRMKDYLTPDYGTMTMLTAPGYRTVTGTAGEMDSFTASGDFSTAQGTLIAGEDNINEGPFMLKRGDKYYLTYSQGGYTSRFYSVWQAVGDSPTGPFTKIDRAQGGLVLGASYENDFMTGTAHHSFVEVGDELMIVYHAHSSPISFADGDARAVAIDRVQFIDSGELGHAILYANGPSNSLQPLPEAISGYRNIASAASVTVDKKKSASGVEYLTDGIFPAHSHFESMEFTSGAKKGAVITLKFDTPQLIEAVMIYNSIDYNKAFSGIASIAFQLDETPDWLGDVKAKNALIRGLVFNPDYYNAQDEFMRPGGSCTAVFRPMRVKKIVITIDAKLSDDSDGGNEIGVAEIVVLSPTFKGE